MKLHEITNIPQQHMQLDEGLKQQLAALVVSLLVATVANGEPLQNTVQQMSPGTKATVAANIDAATSDAEFQRMLMQQATSTSPKVKQTVADRAALKKFGDELKQLTSPDVR